MGAKRKKKPVRKSPDTNASDDERFQKVANVEDEDFYQDEVDQHHSDKIALEKDGERGEFSAEEQEEEEEEVLGVGSESDDDEEVADYKERLKKLRRSQHIKSGYQSDSEEEEEGRGLAGEESWGKKKRFYYDGDDQRVEQEEPEGSGSEVEDAALEEQEALRLQRKMGEQLDEDDFGLDIFQNVSKAAETGEEKITTDVSKLSRRSKLELLKKDSPEVLDLIEDYKTKLAELNGRLLPLNALVKSGRLGSSSGSRYLQTKVALYLSYCVNVSFYLMLKAKHSPQVTSHPVVKRILQHRKLMNEMKEVDEEMEAEVETIFKKLSKGEEIKMAASTRATSQTPVSKILRRAKKKEADKRLAMVQEDSEEEEEEAAAGGGDAGKGGRAWGRKRKLDDGLTSGEREAMEFYDVIRSSKKRQAEAGEAVERPAEVDVPGQDGVEAEIDEDGKRGVTYQILKNKGLQAPKKKELRNPRVKHRMKYRKAKIRRKGQVREARSEMTRYGGEISGIRAGIKRSVKFK